MITVKYDRRKDVLYAREHDARISRSCEHPIDNDLVFNYSHDGRVVGVQIFFASGLLGMWDTHPGRRRLPNELRAEVDRFFSWLDAGPKDPERCASRQVPPEWLLAATT
jgi:uncharacterized protein YuzE